MPECPGCGEPARKSARDSGIWWTCPTASDECDTIAFIDRDAPDEEDPRHPQQTLGTAFGGSGGDPDA